MAITNVTIPITSTSPAIMTAAREGTGSWLRSRRTTYWRWRGNCLMILSLSVANSNRRLIMRHILRLTLPQNRLVALILCRSIRGHRHVLCKRVRI